MAVSLLNSWESFRRLASTLALSALTIFGRTKVFLLSLSQLAATFRWAPPELSGAGHGIWHSETVAYSNHCDQVFSLHPVVFLQKSNERGISEASVVMTV